jgi:mannosyltransferase OCH1-like enzyme
MALDTPLEDQVGGLLKQRIEEISDAVRTLVLLKHGGTYFDLDVLF